MRRVILTTLILVIGMTAPAAAAIFPQLALGGGYECFLIISNKKDVDWTADIYALQANREPWVVGWRYDGVLYGGTSELNVRVPAKSTRKIGIFGELDNLKVGYVKVTPLKDGDNQGTDIDVAFSFFYNFSDAQGHLLDSTGVAYEQAKKEFIVPVEKSTQINTGVAWATLFSNYSIELTLYDVDGNVVATKTIDGAGHYAHFIDEIFEGQLPAEFLGMLYINSDTYMNVTSLRLEYTDTGFQLTSVPPDDRMIW